MKKPSIAHADLIVGMAKGMAVLESFDTERQRLNATLAAQRAGITRAAARVRFLDKQYARLGRCRAVHRHGRQIGRAEQ